METKLALMYVWDSLSGFFEDILCLILASM